MQNDKPIEIEKILNGTAQKYISMGNLVIGQDGFYLYWPHNAKNASKKQWYERFNSADSVIQLLLIGSLARPDTSAELSMEMNFFVEQNKDVLIAMVSKYFIEYEEGLLFRPDDLLELASEGYYGGEFGSVNVDAMPNSVEEQEYNSNYNRNFADGAILHILHKSTTWDTMDDNTFFIASKYDELKNDLELFGSLLQKGWC